MELLERPLVSVILPVFNGARHVSDAIRSILLQTFPDFELIIVNDGSTDDTLQVLKRYTDKRIRIINQKNMGVAAATNIGIDSAQGKYIARQDHDDISLPNRLSLQVSKLEKFPDLGMVGAWARVIGVDGKSKGLHRFPEHHYLNAFSLLGNTPFIQSSVMIRSEVLNRIGNYSNDAARQPPEDFELFSRIVRVYKLENLPEVLVIYREISTSLSRTLTSSISDKVLMLSEENIEYYCRNKNQAHAAAIFLAGKNSLLPIPDLLEIRSTLRKCARKITSIFWERLHLFYKIDGLICKNSFIRLFRKFIGRKNGKR